MDGLARRGARWRARRRVGLGHDRLRCRDPDHELPSHCAPAQAQGNEALRVLAEALRQGDDDAAARALEEGVALARDIPYPYAEARILHVDGRHHAADGKPGPARERLEVAPAIFRRLGARQDGERVEQDSASLVAAAGRAAR